MTAGAGRGQQCVQVSAAAIRNLLVINKVWNFMLLTCTLSPIFLFASAPSTPMVTVQLFIIKYDCSQITNDSISSESRPWKSLFHYWMNVLVHVVNRQVWEVMQHTLRTNECKVSRAKNTLKTHGLNNIKLRIIAQHPNPIYIVWGRDIITNNLTVTSAESAI